MILSPGATLLPLRFAGRGADVEIRRASPAHDILNSPSARVARRERSCRPRGEPHDASNRRRSIEVSAPRRRGAPSCVARASILVYYKARLWSLVVIRPSFRGRFMNLNLNETTIRDDHSIDKKISYRVDQNVFETEVWYEIKDLKYSPARASPASGGWRRRVDHVASRTNGRGVAVSTARVDPPHRRPPARLGRSKTGARHPRTTS